MTEHPQRDLAREIEELVRDTVELLRTALHQESLTTQLRQLEQFSTQLDVENKRSDADPSGAIAGVGQMGVALSDAKNTLRIFISRLKRGESVPEMQPSANSWAARLEALLPD